MSLIRLLLLLLLCWIIFAALRAFLRGHRQKTSGPQFRADEEDMVLDPQCHSYVPKSEAILRSGQYFCSQECARLYLSR